LWVLVKNKYTNKLYCKFKIYQTWTNI